MYFLSENSRFGKSRSFVYVAYINYVYAIWIKSGKAKFLQFYVSGGAGIQLPRQGRKHFCGGKTCRIQIKQLANVS